MECPILAVWAFIRVIIELMITPLANHKGGLNWLPSICSPPKPSQPENLCQMPAGLDCSACSESCLMDRLPAILVIL